jgi:hypothetical protein
LKDLSCDIGGLAENHVAGKHAASETPVDPHIFPNDISFNTSALADNQASGIDPALDVSMDRQFTFAIENAVTLEVCSQPRGGMVNPVPVPQLRQAEERAQR